MKSNAQDTLLASIIQSSEDGIISKTLEGNITTWNPGAEILFGYSFEEIVGKHISILIPSNRQEEEGDIIEQIKNGKYVKHYETVRIRKDGTMIDISLTVSPIKNSAGEIIGASKIARNITERKKNEDALNKLNATLELKVKERTEKLLKTNRIYTFISQINQIIVHIKDEKTLIKNSCRIATEFGKFKMAWIGLIDLVEKKLEVVGQSGIPDKEITRFHNTYYQDDALQYNVLQTGNYHICNNVQANTELEKWKPFTVKYGIQSCIILPIKRTGNIIGTLNLYAIELNFFDEEEIKLLVEVAGDISFALEVFENARKHNEAEEMIVKNEKRFQALVENSTDAVVVLGADTKPIYISPTVEKVLGYSQEETMKLDLFSMFHTDDLAWAIDVWEQILKQPGVPTYVRPSRMKHKDGNWRWLEGTLTNLLHDDTVNGIIDNFRDVTEKKLIEEQQEFDKNNLDALINNTADLMWSVDTNFKLITANKAFNESVKQILGNSIPKGGDIFLDGFSPKRLKTFKKLYERALAGEVFSEIIYRDFPKETWLEIFYNPIRKGDTIIGVACHSHDITEIKKSERIIREERILLKTLIDNLPVIIYTKDINSVKTLSNRSDYEYLGATSEKEVLGKDEFYFQPAELARQTILEDQQIFNTGKAIINKEELRPKRDGSTVWFLKSKIPIKNQNNEIIGLLGIGFDITERKKAEQQLKNSEAFNRGVIDSLSAHIAVIDALGKILMVNDAWKRFKVGSEETILKGAEEGINYFEVCKKHIQNGDKIAAEALQGIKDIMEGNKANFHLEYSCVVQNEQRWYIMRVMKFENDNPMVVISHQNITELKEAKKERDYIQKANQELELTKQELHKSLTKERDLSELKSRFVSMASHEFRTPLTTILSSVSLITKYLELGNKENQLKHINRVKISINNLTDILNDFLSLSKLEEGKIEYNPEKINLKNFIAEIISDMRFMALHEQKLVLNYSGNEMVLIDKKLLKNILHNLISNAIKFSPKQGIIEIIAKGLKTSIKISIKDNGIGISKEDQKHLFERFYRGHNATNIQGTGLGLNIVARYLEQMNGSINFESEENKGTTFTITIIQ